MPLTPTRASISAASATLTEITQATWVSLIRQSPVYVSNRIAFASLESAIAAASGTTKGKQLNAAIDLLEELPPVSASLEDDDGLTFSLNQQRADIVAYAITVLFETPPNMVGGQQRRTSSSVPSIPTF